VSHYHWVVVSLGFIDIDSPLLSGGAFHRGVPEDSVTMVLLGCSSVVLSCLCTLIFDGSPGLRMNLEISLIYQVMKVSSEGSTVHCAVVPPFMKSAVVKRLRPFRVRWERFG